MISVSLIRFRTFHMIVRIIYRELRKGIYTDSTISHFHFTVSYEKSVQRWYRFHATYINEITS